MIYINASSSTTSDRVVISIDHRVFSVNDQVAGNVVGDGGVLRTTLKFFAWADKNHMPIRRMIVDFDDGGEYDATNGPYPIPLKIWGHCHRSRHTLGFYKPDEALNKLIAPNS